MYCGYVVYTPKREMYRNASESCTFCVALPGEHWLLFPWFLLLGCLLLGSFLLPVVVCRHYVRKKSTDALKLTTSNVPPPMWHPPGAITYSIAKSYHYPVGFSYGDLESGKLQMGPKFTSSGSGSYSPQDEPSSIVQPSTGQGASLLSDLVTTGETEWLGPGTGREEERTIYTQISPLCFNNSNDSPSHSIPPINLADCETSSMTFLSGYKQHWVPLAPQGLTAEDNFGISSYAPQQAWIDQEEEAEEGEEGGNERIREFFLGGWVVQIL
ncbi:uncharacterized protein LOC118364302 isoform X2 [Oncorhynchus keta]|nr:uncharacterized protein LOC118364302 isoform X2 [Oncorhynchus keta]